jgi:hypothetical protein
MAIFPQPELSDEEFLALRMLKIGKHISPTMKKRLEDKGLAEETSGGLKMTNSGLSWEATRASFVLGRRNFS